MTNCWGWGTCYGSAAHPGGVAIPPNRPILQELCYSTSCSQVVFFRRKRRSCSSPPEFSWRLLHSFRRDWLSFLLWTNITFLFVPVWSSLLYLFVPRVPPLGSGSDYSPFCQRAGVPSADIRYVFDMVCTTKFKLDAYRRILASLLHLKMSFPCGIFHWKDV